jgi:nitroreductase
VPSFDEVIRTTFSAREFTDEDVTDEEIGAVLDQARFASSGGNAQGWRVVAVRSAEGKAEVVAAGLPTARRYFAGIAHGERPYNTITPSVVTESDIAAVSDEALRFYTDVAKAPVLLVVAVDLSVVSSNDADMDRVGVTSGGSIYPFVQNILLACRARGLAGVMTTFAVPAEHRLIDLLGLPENVAIATVMPIGRPAKVIRRLSRNPVESFARWERWDGRPVLTPEVSSDG